MINIKRKLMIAGLSACLFTSAALATPLEDGVATFNGASEIPITGEIDIPFNQFVVDPWLFFGIEVITSDTVFYQSGTHTTAGGTFTVPDGGIGANMKITWNANEIWVVMVWNVVNSGGLDSYQIIDSDGDGSPGHAMTNGPFPGHTVNYEFSATPFGPPAPGINLALNVIGGEDQECTGNSSADVTIMSNVSLIGGAELDSVSWSVDGSSIGAGESITQNLALGNHVVEATAVTTTGEAKTATTAVTVEDTTRPVTVVNFVYRNGQVIDVDNETASPGTYKIDLKVTDTCDPEPVITSAIAEEVTEVDDGDLIRITRRLDNVKINTSAVSVRASGKDASGNFSFTNSDSSKVLRIR